MKNTLENKTKFFAQYYGQKVLLDDNLTVNFTRLHYGIEDFKNWWLELKPLSEISNEDALEISDFVYADRKVDYLRSKGYAIPWNGISVEEMIEFGWVKLK